MITEKDVWYSYQRAKGKDVEYPSDKKWGSIYKRLSGVNKENVETLTKYLNTVWQNVDLDKYMKTGFYLWKTFSYKHFLDKRLLDKYKQLDKSDKRKKVSNTDLKQSIKFLIYNRYPLSYYGSIRNEGFSLPIEDYLRGYIDSVIITYMIIEGHLEINSNEKPYIPYIMQRYEELKDQVRRKKLLLTKMEEVIMSKQ